MAAATTSVHIFFSENPTSLLMVAPLSWFNPAGSTAQSLTRPPGWEGRESEG